MKKNNFIYFVLTTLLLTIIGGCHDDEITTIRGNLLSSTWVENSILVPGMEIDIREIWRKDEFTFFKDSTFHVTGLKTVCKDSDPFNYKDTIIQLRGTWFLNEDFLEVSLKYNNSYNYFFDLNTGWLTDTIVKSDTATQQKQITSYWLIGAMDQYEFYVAPFRQDVRLWDNTEIKFIRK